MSTSFDNIIRQKWCMCIVQLDTGDKMEIKEFAVRLARLRNLKGVSARDMSLSLGLSPGYINNVENCVSFPSMTVFFYICEYLGVTPSEFFDTESQDPVKEKQLAEEMRGLKSADLELLLAMAKSLKKSK